jgi:hypothetical protein
MSQGRRTESVVKIRTPLGLVDRVPMPAPAEGVTIAEGKFITIATTGKAALAGTSSVYVMLAFIDSTNGSVSNSQGDPLDESSDFSAVASAAISTGGMTAINGRGERFGLSTGAIASGSSAVPGDYITSGASGAPTRVATGSISSTRAFGIVTHVEHGVVYFLFNSTGVFNV